MRKVCSAQWPRTSPHRPIRTCFGSRRLGPQERRKFLQHTCVLDSSDELRGRLRRTSHRSFDVQLAAPTPSTHARFSRIKSLHSALVSLPSSPSPRSSIRSSLSSPILVHTVHWPLHRARAPRFAVVKVFPARNVVIKLRELLGEMTNATPRRVPSSQAMTAIMSVTPRVAQ